MSIHLITWITVFSLILPSSSMAQENYLRSSKNQLEVPLPSPEFLVSDEIRRRSFAFERYLLIAEPQNVRILDALANASPLAAASLVTGISNSLEIEKYRHGTEKLSNLLSKVPKNKLVSSLKQGVDGLLLAWPEMPKEQTTGFD